jgi:hypothetical protein
MIRMRQITAVTILLLLLSAGLLGAREQERRNQQEEAAYRLEIAENLYQEGDYQSCLQILDGYIADHDSKTFVFPRAQMAQVYRLRALLAYAFRGDGEAYRKEVKEYLLAGLEEDPELELGSPSEVPVFVQELFYQVRDEYLGRFSRTSRRFTVGLLGALVIDPTLLVDPSFLQPGITFSYNLSEQWSLSTDLQIPLSLPIWDAIRGQVGFSWYPDFSITRINTAIVLAYAFSLDNLQTYTHSVSIAGQAERIFRMGLGAGVRVEVVRLDLILGSFSGSDLPTYRSIALFGETAFRASYANMNFFITYTF